MYFVSQKYCCKNSVPTYFNFNLIFITFRNVFIDNNCQIYEIPAGYVRVKPLTIQGETGTRVKPFNASLSAYM